MCLCVRFGVCVFGQCHAAVCFCAVPQFSSRSVQEDMTPCDRRLFIRTRDETIRNGLKDEKSDVVCRETLSDPDPCSFFKKLSQVFFLGKLSGLFDLASRPLSSRPVGPNLYAAVRNKRSSFLESVTEERLRGPPAAVWLRPPVQWSEVLKKPSAM